LRVIVEADGGSRGNPGPAGYGAVVLDPESGEVLAERAESIGTATNNVAEYGGLIAGLAAAAELGASHVDVRMDSKLVVEQMSGRWQIKNAGLRPLAAQAADRVRQFSSVSFSWIPRERNKRADALANRAMDAAAGIVRPGSGAAGAGAASAGAADPAGEPARPVAAGSWEPRSTAPLRQLLVRHGETEMTAQRRYSGRADVPLTDRGLAQGTAVGARLAGLATPLAAVVTSPLERCVRTAELVAGGAPIVVDDDLIECNFGAWDGLRFDEVRERWPAELREFLASPEAAPPGGESLRQVAERSGRAVERLRQGYRSGLVAVVSHVFPIKVILRDALAAGDAFLYRCHLDPAGISTVDTWPDGAVSVRSVNDTAHL
jgi:broad specificity phosphatase PhoE/ribonuclease HI